MVLLTPGVIFLSHSFVSLLFPFSVATVVRFILDNYFGIFVPKWVPVAATVLVIPVMASMRFGWAELNKHRRAAALGARVAPIVPGRWPGNLDVLMGVVEEVQHGYLGKNWTCFHLMLSNDEICSGLPVWMD